MTSPSKFWWLTERGRQAKLLESYNQGMAQCYEAFAKVMNEKIAEAYETGLEHGAFDELLYQSFNAENRKT
jgi:hypothetical protein